MTLWLCVVVTNLLVYHAAGFGVRSFMSFRSYNNDLRYSHEFISENFSSDTMKFGSTEHPVF